MDPSGISEMRIGQFNEDVADHNTFCGGGSVAAVTAAGAASLVLLVLGLSEKRKANARHQQDIRAAIEAAQASREQFIESADADAQALDELLRVQAELRSSKDRTRYQAALLQAASTPQRTAEECLNLLTIIHAQMRRATRFTVSDLGAAGALAFGALQASTLMAEVNLALLLKEDGVDRSGVQSQLEACTALVERGRQLTESIDGYTRSAIRRNE